MVLTVDKIIKETEDAVSVVFKKTGFFNKITYKPGQFLTVKLPIKDRIEKRAYSLSSSPYIHKFLRITVKKVEKGLVSNYIFDNLKEGQKVEIDKPAGSFFVIPKKKNSYKYVLFAAGSGITPIYSIIMSILEKEPQSSIMLFYANRNIESIIFKKELESLKLSHPQRLQIAHILEQVLTPQEGYHQDLLNEELVLELMQEQQLSFEEVKYFICGPQGFMDKAKEILSLKGITRDKIKLEAFSSNFITSSNAKDIQSNVTILYNGEKHNIDVRGDKTILQAAMAKNIILPYSCRSGMCSSCKANCISGDIKMVDGHLLSDAEVENGYILTCVSFPRSETVELVID